MLRIDIAPESTPTRKLSAELRRIAPDLFAGHDRNTAHLTLRPRRTDCYAPEARQATVDGWYDLVWTHPDVQIDSVSWDDEVAEVEHVTIGVAATLPAPKRIPVERRLTEAPPVTLDGVTPEMIRLHGGEEEILRIRRSHQETAIRWDTSADAYDWTTYADLVAATVRQLTPPKLTAGQRARVAAVRLLEAHREVNAARQAVTALIGNADKAGDTTDADAVRAVLDLIDPQPTTVNA